MARLRRRVRRAIARPLDRWRQRSGPLLSIVVPVLDGAATLDECLLSARRQDHRRVEIIVIDDGSTDDSLERARAHARADRRVAVLSQPHAGVGEARRAGVERATGAFLTFLDADDTVTRRGLRAAMEVLEWTGSDVAVMPYQRQEGAVIAPPDPWIETLHARPARHVTLQERPDLLLNEIACGKIFRRAFWVSAGLSFPTVLLAGDQCVTAKAYRDAHGIDISEVVGYTWRRQETSMSQGQVTAEAVGARLDAIDAVLALLEPIPQIRAERALQYLRHNVAGAVLILEQADDDYLEALVRRVPAIVEAAPSDRYETEVPAEYRVLYALLAVGDRATIRRYVQAEGMQPEMHPTGIEPAGLTAYLPGWGHDPVPPEAYVLTAGQAEVQAVVRTVHQDGTNLVLGVEAWFPGVDLVEPLLSVKTDGDLVDVVQWGEPHVSTSRQGAQRRYPGSGWSVTLSGVARRAPRQITVTLTDGAREGTTTTRIPA
ncbi:glycosyltransferase family 2 protein [Aeromicrobium sp. A1-2]|uniref:glycosyltransferase family 2 protein n=1 Tax=Aeromicrobium sp. A1-2 TaxID=2107713 RepID=UPI0013C34865|nr:glycosyltransferase family 2 protein [Aeromicrobium sp. A1-2]